MRGAACHSEPTPSRRGVRLTAHATEPARATRRPEESGRRRGAADPGQTRPPSWRAYGPARSRRGVPLAARAANPARCAGLRPAHRSQPAARVTRHAPGTGGQDKPTSNVTYGRASFRAAKYPCRQAATVNRRHRPILSAARCHPCPASSRTCPMMPLIAPAISGARSLIGGVARIGEDNMLPPGDRSGQISVEAGPQLPLLFGPARGRAEDHHRHIRQCPCRPALPDKRQGLKDQRFSSPTMRACDCLA